MTDFDSVGVGMYNPIKETESHEKTHKGSLQKNKENIYGHLIYLPWPPPSPHNKDIKNKDIFASCLTPSLLPKDIWFLGGVTEEKISVYSIENPRKLSNKKLKTKTKDYDILGSDPLPPD